jgi:hypothetical protein
MSETWDTFRYDGHRYCLYRSVAMSKADTTAGHAVLLPATPRTRALPLPA